MSVLCDISWVTLANEFTLVHETRLGTSGEFVQSAWIRTNNVNKIEIIAGRCIETIFRRIGFRFDHPED